MNVFTFSEILNPSFNQQGMVYAVDESTLFIKGFVYDGVAPDAFFW